MLPKSLVWYFSAYQQVSLAPGPTLPACRLWKWQRGVNTDNQPPTLQSSIYHDCWELLDTPVPQPFWLGQVRGGFLYNLLEIPSQIKLHLSTMTTSLKNDPFFPLLFFHLNLTSSLCCWLASVLASQTTCTQILVLGSAVGGSYM